MKIADFDNRATHRYGFAMSRDYVLQPFRAAVHLQIDYARELNEQQLAAVTAEPGPSLVIAVRGFGQDPDVDVSGGVFCWAGDSGGSHSSAHFHEQGGEGNDAAVTDCWAGRRWAIGAGTFPFDWQPDCAPARAAAGVSTGFYDHGIARTAKHLITTCVAESNIDVKATRFPKGRGVGGYFFAGVEHAKGRSRRFSRSITIILPSWPSKSRV